MHERDQTSPPPPPWRRRRTSPGSATAPKQSVCLLAATTTTTTATGGGMKESHPVRDQQSRGIHERHPIRSPSRRKQRHRRHAEVTGGEVDVSPVAVALSRVAAIAIRCHHRHPRRCRPIKAPATNNLPWPLLAETPSLPLFLLPSSLPWSSSLPVVIVVLAHCCCCCCHHRRRRRRRSLPSLVDC
jgi:hypothetical protein